MEELKPCPFCGGKAELSYRYLFECFWVVCEQCGTESAAFGTEDGAIEAWNRRAYEKENNNG